MDWNTGERANGQNSAMTVNCITVAEMTNSENTHFISQKYMHP